jgi:hypothetical protein
MVDIDLDAAIGALRGFDPAGHERHVDVFTLTVDAYPKPVVIIGKPNGAGLEGRSVASGRCAGCALRAEYTPLSPRIGASRGRARPSGPPDGMKRRLRHRLHRHLPIT